MKTLDDVYAYWFAVPMDYKKWFLDGEKLDVEIRTAFGSLHTRIATKDIVTHDLSTKHVLATIILLDQFSRHIYRGQAAAYAADARALRYALTLLNNGQLAHLQPSEQLFALMPLQHSEWIGHKDIVLAFATRQLQTCDVAAQPIYTSLILHTRGHREVLLQFGRYPKRNAALHRTSTPEEHAYLRETVSRAY